MEGYRNEDMAGGGIQPSIPVDPLSGVCLDLYLSIERKAHSEGV